MKAIAFWRAALGASRAVSALVTPVSLGAVWLARQVHRLEDRCDTQLLLARVRLKVATGARLGSRR